MYLYDKNGNEINIGTKSFKDKTIGILGDSITFGTGASDAGRDTPSPEKGYAPQLVKEFQNGVIAGYPGYTISQIIANIGAIPTNRDYVIFFGGTNDTSHTTTQIKTDADNAFATLRATFPNAVVVAITPYIWDSSKTIEEQLERIKTIKDSANAHGIMVCELPNLVGFSGKVAESKEIFFDDNVHPNDTGHTRLYETVLQYLNTI